MTTPNPLAVPSTQEELVAEPVIEAAPVLTEQENVERRIAKRTLFVVVGLCLFTLGVGIWSWVGEKSALQAKGTSFGSNLEHVISLGAGTTGILVFRK